jgi:hypothetical protein
MREMKENGNCGRIVSKIRKRQRSRRQINDIKLGRIVKGRENEEEITRGHERKGG